MIVKYVRECKYHGGGKVESLTLGKDYLVLGVGLERKTYSNGTKKEPYVCIQEDDDDYPCLFELSFFEVVDPRVPDGWSFSRSEDGAYYLEPKEFEGDFWEKFHNGEPNEIEKILRKHRGEEDMDAQRIFKEVVKKIKGFHGLLPEPKEP